MVGVERGLPAAIRGGGEVNDLTRASVRLLQHAGLGAEVEGEVLRVM